MALSPGTRLGPYEGIDILGAGGMGEVYRARDTKRGREVAVKVLPDALLRSHQSRIAGLEREARFLGLLLSGQGGQSAPAAIHVVVNWFEELKGRVGSAR